MPGYLTKQEDIAITGAADLIIQSLLDKQQFADPLGAAEALGISSAAWPLFGLLWPSGAQLAQRMASRPLLAGERVLEIGCGLGLASLVCHRRGIDVTASDCHPLAQQFLQENARLNGLSPVKYRTGQWGSDAPAPANAVQGQFDLIMGSDVPYERDARASLATFLTTTQATAHRSGSWTRTGATAPAFTNRWRSTASRWWKSDWTTPRRKTARPTRADCWCTSAP